MTTPLLRSKVHVPRVRPELVSRPRLLEQLNAGLPGPGRGLDRRLTPISAPAHFGKTTLVSSWLHHLPNSPAVAWAPGPPSSAAAPLNLAWGHGGILIVLPDDIVAILGVAGGLPAL